MKTSRSALLGVLLAAGIAVGLGGRAEAVTPTEELRKYTDRVLEILQSPTVSARDKRTAVRRLATEVFDTTETARRALGVHWPRRTPAEQEEFTRLFATLLELTYVNRIDEYGGERLRYVDERIDGDIAAVRAVIITRSGVEVPVESRLSRRGGRWRIYDVLVANISLVGNYRSQFDRVIRSGSFEELLDRIKRRIQTLSDGDSRSSLSVPARA